MKTIDKLIIKSFIGPAVLSYFVATFVLVMQFLWKYIDEILGKGLTVLELLELIFYYAVTLIPMAVPITVLISSVMVFGDMAEKYELSSMKSAGVSLVRIMFPGILVASLIGLFSILSANYLKPASLLQFNKRFLAIRKQKTALAIEEGIFNDAFGETIIRVNNIKKNKRDIEDVLIYDHTPNDKSLVGVMSAKKGEMYTTADGRYFVMKLDTGVHYKEGEKKSKLGTDKTEIPFMRTYFDQWTKSFDMNQFEASEGLLNFNRNREDMMNTFQLFNSLDSFRNDVTSNNKKISSRLDILFADKKEKIPDNYSEQKAPNENILQPNDEIIENSNSLETTNSEQKSGIPETSMDSYRNSEGDSLRNLKDEMVKKYNSKYQEALIKSKKVIQNKTLTTPPIESTVNTSPKKLIKLKNEIDNRKLQYFVETVDSVDYRDVIVRAQTDLSRDRDELLTLNNMNSESKRLFEKYMLRLNQQYSWAMICIIFLFIGAPLGSIIRKGGYGYPLLVAILFYMIFIISTIYGEKQIRNDLISGFNAAWLPCLILLPFAGSLTYMALRDIRLNFSAFTEIFLRFGRKKD